MDNKKPRVKLVGFHDNVFNIMALCKIAAIKAGWSKDRIDTLVKQMMESDSNKSFLALVEEHFEIL